MEGIIAVNDIYSVDRVVSIAEDYGIYPIDFSDVPYDLDNYYKYVVVFDNFEEADKVSTRLLMQGVSHLVVDEVYKNYR